MLIFCLIFCQFQPGVSYESVVYKKSVYLSDYKLYDTKLNGEMGLLPQIPSLNPALLVLWTLQIRAGLMLLNFKAFEPMTQYAYVGFILDKWISTSTSKTLFPSFICIMILSEYHVWKRILRKLLTTLLTVMSRGSKCGSIVIIILAIVLIIL